ncbi:MAG: sulfatase family protein [Terriglobia bacterium]
MKRREFITGLGAGAASLGALARSARPAEPERPNVLLILPDEWCGQALGCMGNHDVRTPNLDRLASEGILFENTLANTPVCCPARANLLTGTYTSTNGMVANDLRLAESRGALGDLFGRAGYRTAYIGKWHLDGGPRLPGFIPPGARRHGFQTWAANECWHNYFYGWYFRNTNSPIITTKYEPEGWTDLAIEFLREQRNAAGPFFLMMAVGAPHDPYIVPEEYLKMYNPASLTMRPNWVEGVPRAGRKDIAAYYAAITAIDDQIGRIAAVLRELGLEENTIVLFTSDHGNMLGSQRKILKRKPWEESIRVPGIFRYPKRIKPGSRSSVLLSHVDLAPTLLSLCDIRIPAGMQGSDLARVVRGEQASGPASAFFQIFGPYHAGGVRAGWRAIRTERYMYARWQSGPWLMYDLQADPYEMKNLVAPAAARSIRSELDSELQQWMKRIGDSWKLNWTAPVEDAGRLYNYRTFYTVAEYLQWANRHPNLANLPA